MEKNRKKFSSWIAAITLLFLLGACSPMNSNSATDEEIEEPTKEVVENEKDEEIEEEEDETEEVEEEESDLENEEEENETDSNPVEQIPLTIYQADDQLMALEKMDAELELNKNIAIEDAFEELLTGQKEGQEDIYLLPEGTKINSLFLNEEDIVEVDLSSEYISNMNAGSSAEEFYLKGLVNTLAEYYGVQDVLLTIDGSAYESGHFAFEEGQTLSFDDSIVKE